MRCSSCWNDGHTKTTCPKRLKHIEAHPESWEARQFKESKERRQKKNQRCSYCEVTGHTRQSCEDFKSDVDTLVKANMLWRKKMAEHMCEIGYAPGTILETDGKWWHENKYHHDKRLVMIDFVDWERLHFGAYVRGRISRDHKRAVKGVFLDGRPADYDHARCWVPIPHIEHVTQTMCDWQDPPENIEHRYNQTWKVVSPVSEKAAAGSVDSGFLDYKECKKVVMGYMNDDPYSNNASKKRPKSGVNMNEFPWWTSNGSSIE